MKRAAIVLVCAIAGAAFGALVAYIGAIDVVVCHDNPPPMSAACAGGSGIIAMMWGAPIGLVLGFALGLAVTSPRRRSGGIPS